MTTSFIIAAAVLALAAIAVLLRPFLGRAGNAPGATRQSLNAAIFRDQLAELERDRNGGSLAEAEYQQSKDELQRRMLADTSVADAPAVALKTPKALIVTLAVAVPVCAALLYAVLGNLDAQREQAASHNVTAQQIDDMVAKLAARLEKNPEDLKGWVILARSYKTLARFDLAEKAYARLGDALDKDAGLLAEYADVLAMRADGNLEGKPQAMLDKALRLDPENPLALELAGYSAFKRNRTAEAIGYWERLLKQLPAESEHAQQVTMAIDQARGGSASAGAQAAAPPASKPAAKSAVAPAANSAAKSAVTPAAKGGTGAAAAPPAKAANAKSALSGRVTLAPALAAQVQAQDTLFIFARAAKGPRVPLAVLRTTAGVLPLDFTLDDTQAMSPEFALSAVAAGDEVRVEARISKSGEALPKTGDLVGEAGPVKPGAKGLKIVIERVVP